MLFSGYPGFRHFAREVSAIDWLRVTGATVVLTHPEHAKAGAGRAAATEMVSLVEAKLIVKQNDWPSAHPFAFCGA